VCPRMGGTCCSSSFSPLVELSLAPLLEVSVALCLRVVAVLWLIALLAHLLLDGHPILACLRHSGPAILLVVAAPLPRVR